MRTSRLRAAALAVAFFFSFPAMLTALNGQIIYTEGDVAVRSAGGTRDAVIGDALAAGDTVVTGPACLAVIDLANRTTLKLREKTTVAIDSIGEATSVTLTVGGVFTSIAGKLTGRFSLHTDSAVAGVRGTQFFVAYGRSIDAKPDV